MLKLAGERDGLHVVDDEIISPTSTVELAKQIVTLSRAQSLWVVARYGRGELQLVRICSKNIRNCKYSNESYNRLTSGISNESFLP